MGRNVFVSYASPERTLAEAIVAAAEAAEITCWIAPRDIVAGSDWAESIPPAIADAAALLLVLSANSIASKEVVREVHLANTRDTPIVPFRVDASEPAGALAYLISGIHRIDATGNEAATGFAALVERLRATLGSSREERAPLSMPTPRAMLPVPASSFVGRANEAADVSDLVASSRLTTIAGPGGIGKTRLALHVASAQTERFPWIVYAELAPLSSGALVSAAVASAAAVTLPAQGDPVAALAHALRDRHVLLVLDNCEHVVDDAAELVAALLRGCPHLAVLATSRSALGVDGEVVYRIPGLCESEAVALFTARARAVNHKFALADGDREIVVEICRRLDGIALAIELAAARTPMLSVAALRDRLGERFALLSGAARGRPSHQKTLQAVFDWSYDLLDERERRFFRRCAAFSDPFTLEAAAAVHGGGIGDYEALDLLDSLVDKSLIVPDTSADPPRYRFLESTRAYACDKLAGDEAADAVAARHFAYFLERFSHAGEVYDITVSDRVLADLALELNDARTAIVYAEQSGNVGGATDLFLAAPLWDRLGLRGEAIERAQSQLSALGVDDLARRARLWTAIAWATSHAGDWTVSSEAAVTAVALARQAGNAGVLSDALARLAWCKVATRQFDEAHAALDEEQSFNDQTVRRRLQILDARSVLAFMRENLDQAAGYLEESRTLCRLLGNDRGAATASGNLAEVEHARRDTPKAIAVLRDAIPESERVNDGGALTFLLRRNLAGYLAAAEDTQGAREAAMCILALRPDSAPSRTHVAVTLEHLALALAIDGDAATAAALEGYAERVYAQAGFQREYTEQTTNARLLTLLAQALGEHLAAALAAGSQLTSTQAVSLARSACENATQAPAGPPNGSLNKTS